VEIDHATEDVPSVFDRAAATYERVGPRFFSHFGQRVVDLVAPTNGARVLDAAAGAGAILIPAAERVGPDGRVIGVDLAESMVERLRQEISDRGVGNAEAHRMDARTLTFADASFDYVLCGFALDIFPDAEEALAEFHRVLRPGGRIGLSVSSGWWWEGDGRWRWHAELLSALGVQLDEGIVAFATPRGVRETLRSCQFADESVIEETFPLVWANFDEWWKWAWSHGYRRILEAMTQEDLHRYREVCSDHLSSQTTKGGIGGRLEVLLATARTR
jgi:O-methyltransferase / aklanonic acid methyltransferase